jgi:predicted SprT family Zn-dependent metalloprotease
MTHLALINPDDLLCALQDEFQRLNCAHFGGRLILPEIILSPRKTYGGYYQPKNHRIVLSLQAYREHGWDETLNTFRHEVAHIVHPNHSPAFWKVALSLGATQRYARSPLTPARTMPKNYTYICDACGRRLARVRPMKLASCGFCASGYNPQFKLRLLTSEKEDTL